MSFIDKILNKSNSYVFYKSQYKKLKKENSDLKKKIKKFNSDYEVILDKKNFSQKKLAKTTIPQILNKLANDEFDKITIAIKSPNPLKNNKWGDYFFAKGLKKALQKKGFNVILQQRDNWYDNVKVDITIVLRGLREYEPNLDEINLMWNISHPDLVSDEEYEKYDIVFVASEKYTNILKNRLNTSVITLLQCTDPEIFYPEINHKLSEDILFVGVTRGVYRTIIKDLFKTNHEVSIYGKGWDKFIDEKYIKDEYIPNEKLHEYYSSCKILLNDHWNDMIEFDFPSNRLFDALACGTFVISDKIPSEEELFENTIVTYDDVDDLDEKISYYLNNPQKREEKALKGKNIVLKNHTFDNRVDIIVDELKKLKKNIKM